MPRHRLAEINKEQLIDRGVDIEKVRHRPGHGDLTTTTAT
jgi:hypothetical protein